ncbi:MAG: NapC/NirT family cytochrome c [Thermodesulfobacteriota bacterium]
MTLPVNRDQVRKWLNYLVILALLGAGGGLFLAFGPPNLFAKTGSPEYCASCHVMETEFENWFHHGGHRRIKCVDCHLPNDHFPNHALWKGIQGMQDMYYFYSGQVPETIVLSARGQAILQDNCRRCHEETIALINEDRPCWSCHRRLSHRTSGTF